MKEAVSPPTLKYLLKMVWFDYQNILQRVQTEN